MVTPYKPLLFLADLFERLITTPLLGGIDEVAFVIPTPWVRIEELDFLCYNTILPARVEPVTLFGLRGLEGLTV